MSSGGIDAVESLCVLAGEVVVLELGSVEVCGEAAAGDFHAHAAVWRSRGDGDEERLQRSSAIIADGKGDGIRWKRRGKGVAMAGENGWIGGGERGKRKEYQRRKVFQMSHERPS